MDWITKHDLRAGNACSDQIALFEHHYPNGISVCRYCAQEAQKKGLSVYWLIYCLPCVKDYRFVHEHTTVKYLKEPIVAASGFDGRPYEICSIAQVDELGLIRLERAFLKKTRMIEPRCTN